MMSGREQSISLLTAFIFLCFSVSTSVAFLPGHSRPHPVTFSVTHHQLQRKAGFSQGNQRKSAIIHYLSSNRKELNIATHSSTDLEISSKMNRLVTKMGSTTSIVVAGTFFAVLAYKRDAFMLTFWIGSILNGISSKILKRILNQSRPVGYIHDDSVKVKPSDNGMPSSHAMSLGFIGTYTVLGLWEVVGGGMNGIILSLLLSSYSIISLAYRVKSNLHTMDQILVGSCFGIINSLLWRSLALGTCELLPSFNMMDLVKTKLLPESGIMPITGLIIPAAVGVVLVGSFERRVSNWIKKIKKG